MHWHIFWNGPKMTTNPSAEIVCVKKTTTWKIVVIRASPLMLQILISPSQYYQNYEARGFVQLIENEKCRNVCFQLSADFHIFASNWQHSRASQQKTSSSLHKINFFRFFFFFARNSQPSLASCILASCSLTSSKYLSKRGSADHSTKS